MMKGKELPDKVKAMWEYYQEGHGTDAVGKKFRCAGAQVYILFTQWGLPIRSAEEAREIRREKGK